MSADASLLLQDLVGRFLANGKFDSIQIWFDAAVLDRYRADPDAKIVRSDSAGRLKGSGSWMVNFGIAPDDSVIHLAISSLLALPESHQKHWLSHLVHLPVGENFLIMSMHPASCIDDGESRVW